MSAFGSFGEGRDNPFPTGATVYMTVRNRATGQWFKPGTGFADVTTTRTDFDNPMEESPAGTGQFVLTSSGETALLAALVAGTEYEWNIWLQSGASASDTDDFAEYEGEGVYAGSSVFRTIDTAKVSAFASGAITADAIAADAIGASELAAGAANEIADALLDRANGIETGVTPRQAWQRIGATTAGKCSGAGTGTEVFLGLDGLTTRVTVTVEDDGDRTSVAYA